MDTIELYDPKQMTQALLESFPARRFLSATFFGEETHDTKSFQSPQGSRRLSPIVHPKMAGRWWTAKSTVL